MKTCLDYNEERDIMKIEGIKTQMVEFHREKYMQSFPRHLSSFTIWCYYDEEKYINKKRMQKWI